MAMASSSPLGPGWLGGRVGARELAFAAAGLGVGVLLHRALGSRRTASGTAAGRAAVGAPPPLPSDAEAYEVFLYPPIEPYKTHHFQVTPTHNLYVEEVGNPDGEPMLFIHGGPGAGCSKKDRRFFDPEHFRVILVDQRGCNRSTPVGELSENTIDDLVADFELIRKHLGIERWHLFGGSWGSTLSLYYAIKHPEVAKTLTIRGIWLMEDSDLDWWLYTLAHIHPESHRAFVEHLPADQRDGDLMEAYWKLMTGADQQRALAAAKAWAKYELEACTLLPNPVYAADADDDEIALSLARLECLYFRACRPGLIAGVPRIRHIPIFIVHGRYDVICPMSGCDKLARALDPSNTSVVVVADAGHSSHEPGIACELVKATNRIRNSGSPLITSQDC